MAYRRHKLGPAPPYSTRIPAIRGHSMPQSGLRRWKRSPMPRLSAVRLMRMRRTNSLSGLHEVALERPDRRCGPGTRARLVEDVLDVVAHRLGGDAEGLGDLLVGLSCGERKQDLEFAVREARGQLAWSFRHAVSGRGEHGVDRLRAQASVA